MTDDLTYVRLDHYKSMLDGLKSPTPEASVLLPLKEIERLAIIERLAFHSNNKTETAKSLGICIKSLYNKLHEHGIKLK